MLNVENLAYAYIATYLYRHQREGVRLEFIEFRAALALAGTVSRDPNPSREKFSKFNCHRVA